MDELSRKALFFQSVPIIVANVTTPLLGIADTAIIGNLGDTAQLAAVALGSMLITLLYWSFGFLRMSTSGKIAQAQGKQDVADMRRCFSGGVLLALFFGMGMLLFSLPFTYALLFLTSGEPGIEALAESYLSIRFYGAPATLLSYVFIGVFVGLGESKKLLLVQICLNGVNILFDFIFAVYFDMGVAGIALGTILAEYLGILFSLWLLFPIFKKWFVGLSLSVFFKKEFFDLQEVKGLLSLNADIFIRTLFLELSFFWFTNTGASFGGGILAANHVLLQLITFSAFFLDGYAYVAESVVGKAYGAGNRTHFLNAIRKSTEMAAITAIILALTIWVLAPFIINSLTDIEEVRRLTLNFMPYACIYIAFSFMAFQMDGFYIACTQSRVMRNASVISVLFFIGLSLILSEYENDGLWIAFVAYVVIRPLVMLRHGFKTLASLPSLPK